MNKKLISFNIIFSVLCTTNIVFGMDNSTYWMNVISSDMPTPHIFVKDTNNQWHHIPIWGSRYQYNFDETKSIRTNQSPGTIFIPQILNDQTTYPCNVEIPITSPVNPERSTLPTIVNSTTKLTYNQINIINKLSEKEKKELYIEYLPDKISHLVHVLPNKEEKNNKSSLLSTPKNQNDVLPSIATKENPIFHIVLKGLFYKVNSNFSLDEASYYLTGQPCKKPLLLDPSQEISAPIEHDGVLIPLGILQRLQKELIKQKKVDLVYLYVTEGNNEIKEITIKQPAPKSFFAAHPNFTLFLMFGGITGLTFLAVCLMTPGLGTKFLERIMSFVH